MRREKHNLVNRHSQVLAYLGPLLVGHLETGPSHTGHCPFMHAIPAPLVGTQSQTRRQCPAEVKYSVQMATADECTLKLRSVTRTVARRLLRFLVHAVLRTSVPAVVPVQSWVLQ